MLNKDIDHVIVGNSYLSYFLGIKKIGLNKSTLIIEDSRFKFGDFFQSNFTELDRTFIKGLGERDGIETFKQIDQFIVPCPYYIHVNGVVIHLGESPHRNFKEIGRKFYTELYKDSKASESDSRDDLFDDGNADEFNQLFEKFCFELAARTLELPSTKHFDLSTFFKCAPPFLIDLFDAISENYADDDSPVDDLWSIRCLFYSLGGIFQEKFSFSISKFELFHLMVSALSPNYYLDFTAFNQALVDEFSRKGGELRQVELDKWLLDKGHPWALMLSSFEGIVKPKEISLIGSRPESMPIDISPEGDFYKTVEYSWVCEGEGTILPPDGLTFFCCSDTIGTESPFFWCHVTGNKVVISAYLLWREGQKFDFYVDRLKDYLLKELNRSYSLLPENISDASARELRDIALSGASAVGRFEQVYSTEVHVLDCTDISNKVLVNGVNYWGQFRKFPLGKYSMLLDLCLS